MKMDFFGENLHIFRDLKNAKKNLVSNIYLGFKKECKTIL